MTLLCPAQGQIQLLTKMLQAALSTNENYTLNLYQNNHTPAAGDTSSNYTAASFTGYSAATLTRAGWANPSTVSGSALTSYATQSWTAGSSQTVYGYYVLGATSGDVLWAEAFSTARALNSADVLNLNLQFTLT
jgi:hypothetical protein